MPPDFFHRKNGSLSCRQLSDLLKAGKNFAVLVPQAAQAFDAEVFTAARFKSIEQDQHGA